MAGASRACDPSASGRCHHRLDLADACVVRMTELTPRCKVWTVDREDFTSYRRHGRQSVPCEFPPGR
jgi:hypothetical protein